MTNPTPHAARVAEIQARLKKALKVGGAISAEDSHFLLTHLASMQAERDCCIDQLEKAATQHLTNLSKIADLEARLALAERVVEMHHADDSYGACVTCIRPNTDDQHDSYPCPTVLALRTLTTPGGG